MLRFCVPGTRGELGSQSPVTSQPLEASRKTKSPHLAEATETPPDKAPFSNSSNQQQDLVAREKLSPGPWWAWVTSSLGGLDLTVGSSMATTNVCPCGYSYQPHLQDGVPKELALWH